MKPLEAIKKYGTLDENGRLNLYFTMSTTPNSMGLFLYIEDTEISVRHISGEVLAVWELEKLAEQFKRKIPALVLVSAFSDMRGDIEWFNYSTARLLTDPSTLSIGEQIRAGNVLVDLRLHDGGTKARNHGTGFRVYKDKLPNLFKKVEEL